MAELQKMLTMKEVCGYFRISRPTLHAWLKRGLRSYKIANSQRRFTESDVQEFIDLGKQN